MSTILIATLMCDLKRATYPMALPAMLRLRAPAGFDVAHYVNIETERGDQWGDVFDALESVRRDGGRGWHTDVWSRDSSWHHRASRDQDQSRLEPICVARNMARACALGTGASHLLFIDSDVVVEPDGLERLMALSQARNAALVGGLVPGRGAHGGAWYVFGERERLHLPSGDVVRCAHGTLGYCLIRRDLFEVVPFRWGPHPRERHVMLAEDPAFGADAEVHFGVEWLIDVNAKAQHLDDPAKPLTLAEAQNNYHYRTQAS